MKTKKFFMLLAAVLLLSVSAMAQSSEPVRGDLNGDGKVGMPDIMYLVQKVLTGSFPDEGETTYYWYLGYDQDLYDNTESSKSKMLTLSSNNAPTNYTRSSGNKFTIPGETPNYLIMVIPTTWSVPVIGNPAGGELALVKEKSNISISGISNITFDVYSTDIAEIQEVYIN